MKKLLITITILFALTLGALSQVPPPPPRDDSDCHKPPHSVPVGEGAAILVALGIGYGTRKWYNSRKIKLSE